MISRTNFYEHMVAGRAASTLRDSPRTAFFLASSALDTENIHVLSQFTNGEIRYLAVPSVLAANGPLTTQLSASLPGDPSHKGFGIYRLAMSTTVAVVVCLPDQFAFVYHDVDAVDAYLSQYGEVNIYDVSDMPHQELLPARLGARREARRLLERMTIFNMVAATVSAALIGVLMGFYGVSVSETEANTYSVKQELEKVMGDLLAQSQISTQMEELMRISATVHRSGGWVELYRLEDGKSTFHVKMPEWAITQEYIRALGKDVTSDIDPSTKLVDYKKGDPYVAKK